jgi:hypothetical protein
VADVPRHLEQRSSVDAAGFENVPTQREKRPRVGRAGRTAGKLETIQIPGGTQALERIELVEIVVDGVASRVRRSTLLGALSRSHASEPPAPRARSWSLDKRGGTPAPSLCDVH